MGVVSVVSVGVCVGGECVCVCVCVCVYLIEGGTNEVQ